VLTAAVGDDDVAGFVESIRAQAGARFFAGAEDLGATIACLEERVPEWRERTLRNADKIERGVVRILGADEIDLLAGRASLPWHEDFLNDYCWNPRTFYRKVEIPYDRADIKVPWELSRAQYLPTLALAYAASGDDRYAARAVHYITDWLSRNPEGWGVNWMCTMDVAIRAVNWLWAYALLRDAPAVDADFAVPFFASLVAHARHIAGNVEVYMGVSSNHTLADYCGLLYLGLFLGDLPEARAWVESAREGVLECMQTQVLPDGADFENSISYHRLALEMFAGCYVLGVRNGMTFPAEYRSSLERMFQFVRHYTRPDGLAPLVGDNDDGRLQILSRYFEWQPQDHRYLLAVGAAIFGRADFAETAAGAPGATEEVAWLLGATASTPLVNPRKAETRSSRAFPSSGRYVMRDARQYALVSADETGTGGRGNHKHNDIFSFELVVEDVPIVVDPGSFLYTSDAVERHHFRSTAAHNTLMVDEIEQNEVLGPFWMRADARVKLHTWLTSSEFDIFDAEHTGYERLREPVRHRRLMCLGKKPFTWLVVDSLIGAGTHDVVNAVHLAPAGVVQKLGPEIDLSSVVAAALEPLRPALALTCPLDPQPQVAYRYEKDDVAVVLVPLNYQRVSVQNDWVAPRYGQKIQAPLLRLSATVAANDVLGYVIVENPAAE
jgi:uncharacterized heparinase superfamily protein